MTMPRLSEPGPHGACGDATGTLAGYSRHTRRGEQACSACRVAKKEYQAQRDRAKDIQTVMARRIAFTILRGRYPAEFDLIYSNVLAKIRRESRSRDAGP